jgi:hypothetical protein
MKQIHITRDGSGNVTFETVSIDNSENVFFTNKDSKAEHWPTLATNKLGKAPSANSSQCPVFPPQVTNPKPPPPTIPQTPPYAVTYGCQIKGHEKEKGTVNVFAPLAAVSDPKQTPPPPPIVLPPATIGTPITPQQVVNGGMPPYSITGLIVNNNNVPGSSTKPGEQLPIAPGLQLTQDANGISVVGTPTQSGTYNFTFVVNDSMGRNLQQVQYSITVS